MIDGFDPALSHIDAALHLHKAGNHGGIEPAWVTLWVTLFVEQDTDGRR